jgi:hypothetical protein
MPQLVFGKGLTLFSTESTAFQQMVLRQSTGKPQLKTHTLLIQQETQNVKQA